VDRFAILLPHGRPQLGFAITHTRNGVRLILDAVATVSAAGGDLPAFVDTFATDG